MINTLIFATIIVSLKILLYYIKYQNNDYSFNEFITKSILTIGIVVLILIILTILE
jgi:hypothetical protein